MKRMLSVLLALTLALSMCTFAMAEGTAEKVMGTTHFPCNEKGLPDLGGVTLTIWIPMDSTYATFCNNYGEMAIVKQLESMLNVNLEFVHPPVDQIATSFSLMLTENKLPDMIFSGCVDSYYQGGVTMAYEDGFLADYTALVGPEMTPNYWAKVMSEPYLAVGAVDDQGRNYRLGCMVSGSEESCTCMWGLMIRKDYLEKAAMKAPETIDEWYQMLTAFKGMGIKYPLLLNKSNIWQTRNAFSSAWNIDARNFYIRGDGTLAYGPTSPEFKDYLTTLHKWYSEGLINPDFMNNSRTETWSMIANDEAGAVCDHTYAYAAQYYDVVEKQNPDKALVAAQMPKLNAGDPLTRVMYTSHRLDTGNAKYIVSTTEHLKECVAFLDALYIKDIEFLMSNGIEGIGYSMNEFNYPVINELSASDASVEDKLSQRIWEFETESDSDKNYIVTSKYCYGVQPETVELYTQCDYDGIFPDFAVSFTKDEAEVIAKYKSDVNTYRDEMILKFITGTEPLDQFDAFVKNINELGLTQLTEAHQSAYARYLTRKDALAK
ncbi:MAG: extracellular solute-binding protein [Clostridia bacterium]